jgi:hypothetical protein
MDEVNRCNEDGEKRKRFKEEVVLKLVVAKE